MPFNRQILDYEPVSPSRKATKHGEGETAAVGAEEWAPRDTDSAGNGRPHEALQPILPEPVAPPSIENEQLTLKRGHALSYAGLFLFTAVLYFRPYELFPSLSAFSSIAFWLALLTLIIFFPSQLALEGRLTARPPEVNLVLLLVAAALLSIPLAISRGDAWETFYDPFIKAVLMFIVMVNVVRTERRLKGLLFLALGISCVLSLAALNDYRQGRFAVEGYRVEGFIGGMFGNPNDMALYLVTVMPIAMALLLSTRRFIKKIIYGACAVLIVAGITVTYSRSGFLGLICAAIIFAWKLGRRNHLAVALSIFTAAIAFLALAPAHYSNRLLSIFDPSRDAVGSSMAREELLARSIWVSLRHPLLGVGMGNFHILSIGEHVSHNAYTQVAAEMGLAALAIYVLFMIVPLRRLRQIERDTFAARRSSRRYYYLALGLQASLCGYMVSSFFASVAYQWYVYYLVGYMVALRRIYEAERERADKAVDNGKDQLATDEAEGRMGDGTSQIGSRG